MIFFYSKKSRRHLNFFFMKKTITNRLPGFRQLTKQLMLLSFLLAGAVSQSAAQVIVGTGTSTARFPFSFWYGYSRNAAIYTAGELNTATSGGTITTLAWYSGSASSTVGPVVIYLKTVGTATAVASDTWANTIAGATQVYTGTPAAWVTGWNTIDITDFAVPAGQNVEVLVECNVMGTGTGGQTSTAFRYTAAGIDNHAYWQQDTNPPGSTPAASTAGAINNNRPNITFGGLLPPSCLPPASVTVPLANITAATAVVNWTAPATTTPTNYQWEVRTSGAPGSGSPVAGGTVTAPTLTANAGGLTAGTAYTAYVRSQCGTTDFSAWSAGTAFTTSPANDEPSGAVTLTVNPGASCVTSATGTTVSATQSTAPAPGCSATGTDDDVWYTFTATGAIHAIAFTGVSTGTMVAALYTGTPGNLTPVSGACGSTSFTASNLVNGTTYYVRVYNTATSNSTQSNFTICLTSPPPPPVNDECTAAISLTVAPYTASNCTSGTPGTTVSATASSITAPPSSAWTTSQDDDVWYEFTATNAVHVIRFCNVTYPIGTAVDMGVSINAGCTSGNSELAGSTVPLSSGSGSFNATGLTVGTLYKLRVLTNGTSSRANFDITVMEPPPMTYVSSTTTQASTSTATAGTINQQILGVQVVANGVQNPLNVTQMVFSTTGSTDAADIANAKVYYTGSSSTFATTAQFGTAVLNPNGTFTVTGSQALAGGPGNTTNYFWLTYDVSCNATATNVLDAQSVSVTVAGIAQTPTVTNPSGTRAVTALTAYNTIADGDWSNPLIWSCGVVPNSTIAVNVNHNVNVTTSGNTSGNITIATGKTLTISSGDLTMGPQGGGNRTFTNNGILTVNGGTLNLNGNVVIASGSKVNQTAGDINIDGNAAGVTANSVPSGTYILSWTIAVAADLNLTGGTITIVDPHVAATNTFWATYSPTGSVSAGPNHTFRFGDGISSDPGGANGFAFYSWSGSGLFKFGKVILEANTGNAASRFVNLYNGSGGTYCNFSAAGDVVINNGAELRQVGTTSTGLMAFAGNLTVNTGGTLTAPGIVYFGNVTSSSSTAVNNSATNNAQVISGNGTFRNATSAPTANFASLTINNTSTAGVTFANANTLLSGANAGTVSGTLTMTAGMINTGNSAIVLGISAAAAGTYSYTAGTIAGKLKRWISASTGSRVFSVGDASGPKTATINFTAAPSAAGTLTAEWIAGSPGTNGLPLVEGANSYSYVSGSGYWRVTAGDGLTGGTYTATFNGVNVADVGNYATTTFGKRSDASAPWSLDGTAVATTGSNSNFTLSRTGITTGFSEFGILMTTAPLPVTLESFTGRNNGAVNDLSWKTAGEANFSHFELERSADGKSYGKLASVNAQGNEDGSSYGYTDERPFDGKNLYRLRIVDRDGSARLSEVVELYVKSGNSLVMRLHPNPVDQLLHVTIDGKADGTGQVQVLDIAGKVLHTIEARSNSLSIDMSGLPAGTYMVRYSDRSNRQVLKVSKK